MGYRAIFHSEFYQRRLERSVLGFGSALPPSLSPSLSLSLRTYDWTHQYADHETWSKPLAPRRPPPRFSFFVVRSSPLSSLARCPSLPRLAFFLTRRFSPYLLVPRKAKRRLFRRECFQRNTETVLIAGCLV